MADVAEKAAVSAAAAAPAAERGRARAVEVLNAFKSYGDTPVLTGVDMTVPRGTIYGLLGASGCGKTTLLSCIAGRRRLDAGLLRVFEQKPVPGAHIGFMPQDLALFMEFTIFETLYYFGVLLGMRVSDIETRADQLLSLLDLPPARSRVGHLSGGQQRRVSFATALLHDPDLLVLDEPTVGVDPVLRQSIWEYLVEITKTGNKTVIITTHYIEESRQAHTVGLLRGGCLLAEDAPDRLTERFGCGSLENVFLLLSQRQAATTAPAGQQHAAAVALQLTANGDAAQTAAQAALQAEETTPTTAAAAATPAPPTQAETSEPARVAAADAAPVSTIAAHAALPAPSNSSLPVISAPPMWSAHRMKALLWKNFLWIGRNVPIMLFIITQPALQVMFFCMAIGRDPTLLTMAVVNHELNSSLKCPEYFQSNCHLEYLSCRYLHHLNKSKSIVQENYQNISNAFSAVQSGRAWGTIYFTENYTESLIQRVNESDRYDIKWEGSEIQVWMDQSNQLITQTIQYDLFLHYKSFMEDVYRDCDWNLNLIPTPVRFEKPVYGSIRPLFTDFACPGTILMIVFFLSVTLTAGVFLTEKSEGLLERTLMTGLSLPEIFFSHMVTQFAIVCGQTALVLLFAFTVFNIPHEGPMFAVAVLTLLQGISGMCFGFFISAACDTLTMAAYMGMGSFHPLVILSGIIWPIEGMHSLLRYTSYFLPLTYPTESLRCLLLRGWGIDSQVVYVGFLVSIAWIAIFVLVTLTILRIRKI